MSLLFIITLFIIVIILILIHLCIRKIILLFDLVKQLIDDSKNRLEHLELIIKKEKSVNFNSLNNAYKEVYEEDKDKEKDRD